MRKRVPQDLVQQVGRPEVRISLRTKDPGVAKARHAEERAALERRWEGLRQPVASFFEIEAHQFATPAYDWMTATFADNPSSQNFWEVELGADVWTTREVRTMPTIGTFQMQPISPASARSPG
ncbi:DUF6538 domain-containing protein [Terrihabitans sp. B22-R8]|uniref:DUF6538 domain-containing protein n=1 Tax=Terrihabitans sp. B22-R8 TaxID=3425128 RepID=UPI00403C780E